MVDDDFRTIYVGRPKKEPENKDLSFEERKGFFIKPPESPSSSYTKNESMEEKEVFEAPQEEFSEHREFIDSMQSIDEPLFEEEPEENVKNINSVTGNVEGGAMFYKTKDVAEELGISDQEVRNYSQYFAEFLNINKTISGHRRFTRENIDKLAAILEIKENNHYTLEQTKKALSSEEGEIMSARDEMDRLHKLIELMTGRIEMAGNEIKKSVKDEMKAAFNEQIGLLIESRESKENEEIKQLKEQNDNSALLIKQLKEQNEEIYKVLKEISSDQRAKDEKIAELSEQNNRLLEEMQKKKKFKLFG